MKIVVENTVCLNTGDAAILLAIRHIVRNAMSTEPTIDVFDSQPEIAARLYPEHKYPDVVFRKLLSESLLKQKHDNKRLKNRAKTLYNALVLQCLRRFHHKPLLERRIFSAAQLHDIGIYRDADLVITTGGTYLVETYNLEKRINQFRMDCAMGKPPVFFTQSLGPFNNSRNRRHLTPIFDKSPLVLLRDERSQTNLRGLVGDPGKCHVVADSVFALADTKRIRNLLARRQRRETSGRVAISVRHWHYVDGGDEGMRRYIESIAAMVTELVAEHGKSVTFLSTCQGVPEYAHDDSKTARAILAELDPKIAESVSIDDAFHDPEELMQEAKRFDFVISTRMHMMIMSLCVGTPVMPIAYEFKTRELAERIGVSDVLLDIDTMTVSDSLEKLDRFVSGLQHYTETSLENVLEEHVSAMSAGDLLKAAMPHLTQAVDDARESVPQSAA